jgi:hypothetical protein
MEPDEAMIEAAYGKDRPRLTKNQYRDIFRAMIKHALIQA